MSAKNALPIEILLVEDNAGDARLAMEAMRDSKIANIVHHVWDGEEAMAFLRREGKHVGAPRPGLILLDLNLPRRHGTEVLADIKSDDDLKRIPVVVLTVSSAEEDVLKSYNLHANCFVSKPLHLDRFVHVTRSIQDFWLAVVQLPNGSQ